MQTGDSKPSDAAEGSSAAAAADPWSRMRRADDAAAFASAWLELQAGRIGGVRRAVVVMGPRERGPFTPVAVQPAGLSGGRRLAAAVERAMQERKSLIRGSAATEAGGAYDLIAAPILLNDKLYGGVAFEFERHDDADSASLIASLEWACVWFESFIRRRWSPPSERLGTVLEAVATSVHHRRFQEAVTAVATELAARMGCERVSIGFLKDNHIRLRGMSHSATFSRKANLVRALEAAMDEAIDQQATVVFPAPEDGPVQVTRSHAALNQGHGQSGICTIPFADGAELLGAVTLESPGGVPLDADARRLCEHAASLLGPILEVKRKDDRWLGRKAVDSAAELVQRLLGPRNAGLKLGALTGAMLLLFFLVADGNYRVTANARLEGTVQRVVSAPLAGYIARAGVRAGDTVREGDVMAALDDRDLRLERLKWVGQRSQRQREHSEALSVRDRAQTGILAAQIEQADAQIELIEEQLERAAVRAPFDGVVVAGDLSQSLGAPVERGDVLFEVAPLDSYRIVLEVDERDVGAVVDGQAGALALTGLPDSVLEFRVDRITPVSTASEGRNFFRVEASLADVAPASLRPGMEGVGKIEIGERKLIWIWTHKITYWIRMFFWSWWP